MDYRDLDRRTAALIPIAGPDAAPLLASAAVSLSTQRGAMVFREGQSITGVFLLTSGLVKLELNRNGLGIVTAIRRAGSLLGAASAVTGDVHRATAVCLCSCDLLTVPVAEFHRLRGSSVEHGLWLQRMLALEATEQSARTTASTSNCRTRLIEILKDLFRTEGVARPDGSLRLQVDLSITDLSALVGARRETVSRLVAELAWRGVVVRRGDWFVAPSGSPLSRLANAKVTLPGALGSRS